MIPVHSSSPPLLSKLDEQAGGSKRDDGDQRTSQHDILQSDSCNHGDSAKTKIVETTLRVNVTPTAASAMIYL